MREPTDEEVERGVDALAHKLNVYVADLPFTKNPWYERVRVMLRAAFNPPPEPEIDVTPQMVGAGRLKYQTWPLTNGLTTQIAEIYRAMYAARPKEPEPRIHVTQEMAKVGADTICRHWLALTTPDEQLFSEVARETFLAMERVRPRDPS